MLTHLAEELALRHRRKSNVRNHFGELQHKHKLWTPERVESECSDAPARVWISSSVRGRCACIRSRPIGGTRGRSTFYSRRHSLHDSERVDQICWCITAELYIVRNAPCPPTTTLPPPSRQKNAQYCTTTCTITIAYRCVNNRPIRLCVLRLAGALYVRFPELFA